MTDAEKTQLIQDCEGFNELGAAFQVIGDVKGSSKSYTAERLTEKVSQLKFLIEHSGVSFDKIPFNNITRSHGIRAKVIELFYYEINGI